MKAFVLTALATATLTLSGCASWYPETKADKNPDAPSKTSLHGKKLEADRRAAQASAFITESPWLVASTVSEYVQYPILNERHVEISQYGRTLPDMTARLAKVAGVNIFLASDLYVSAGKSDSRGGQSDRNEPQSVGMSEVIDTSNVLTLLGSTGGSPTSRMEDPLGTPISIAVDGSATELFDSIAAQLGISWKYDEARNRVTFHRLSRQNFQVYFPGETETSIGVGKRRDSESVISQESDFELEGGSWEEIAEGVQALLTPFGKATIVKGTGNIVVVDTPEAMEDITSYIEDINDVFGRQVYLQIRTAAVNVENTNDFNMTWRNIINTVNNGDFNIGFNAAEVATNALPNALNVISNSSGATLALEMLAQEMESTEINEQSVTTLSNQPASLKVLTETGYISGISQQDYSNSDINNVVSDVQTDTINTGFDATLVPRVISDNVLQLQVALELSSNLTLVNFDSTIVQTPTRDRNSVVQRAWLRDGETWVIAAFNSEKSNRADSGTGTSGFWGLGGGTSRSNEQQVLLIMITPHVQEGMF